MRAGGLDGERKVVLETSLRDEEQRINFQSVCQFLTNDQGQLDTDVQSPLPGSSYQGIHKGGPLWSLGRLRGSVRRLVVEDACKPLVYQMVLKCAQSGHVLGSQEITKSFVTSGVERRVIRIGRVRGTLFLPTVSNRPAPAIITILGGITNKGTVPEDRAALLASAGFVTLALAFFGADDDLPSTYSDIDISYFEEAVDLLSSLPEVSSKQVGVLGTSKGADISLAVMMFLGDKIGACVAMGGSYASIPDRFLYKNTAIQATKFNFGDDYSKPYHLAVEGDLEQIKQNSNKQILIENSEAPLLSIIGLEDSPGLIELTSFAISRARSKGKTNITHIEYSHTGHLIDLPFCPHSSVLKTPLAPPGMLTLFGGKPQEHALAQFQAWSTIKKFFIDNL